MIKLTQMSMNKTTGEFHGPFKLDMNMILYLPKIQYIKLILFE
jgi:hypothetical protein